MSGKPWKKMGERLDKGHCGISKSWNRRERERKQRQLLKDKVSQVKATTGEKLRKEREKKAEKQKRKEYNMMKGGQYQIIRNTAKLKKLSKKHMKKIKKLPAELFYEKFSHLGAF